MSKRKENNKVAENPNKLHHIKCNKNQSMSNTLERPKLDYRWTTIEDQFVERSNRLTADVDKTRAERGDYEPLYSSFNPNKTFVPPPSAYDALLQRKKEAKKSSASGSTLSKTKGGRAVTAFQTEPSLMASGNANISLFNRVGSITGPGPKIKSKFFKTSAEKGIRSAAFKLL